MQMRTFHLYHNYNEQFSKESFLSVSYHPPNTNIPHLLTVTYNNEPMFNHSRKGPKFLDRNPVKYLFVFACVHAVYMLGDGGTHVSRCILGCVCAYAEGRG